MLPLHMHYTLQQRIADEGIVTGLFQGCSLTLVVSASLGLIYTAGGVGSALYPLCCTVCTVPNEETEKQS